MKRFLRLVLCLFLVVSSIGIATFPAAVNPAAYAETGADVLDASGTSGSAGDAEPAFAAEPGGGISAGAVASELQGEPETAAAPAADAGATGSGGIPGDAETSAGLPGDASGAESDATGSGGASGDSEAVASEDADALSADADALSADEPSSGIASLDAGIVPLLDRTSSVANESDLIIAVNATGNGGDNIYIKVTADFSVISTTLLTFQGNKHFFMTSADPANPCTITIARPTAGAYGFQVGQGDLTITDLIIQGSNNGGSIFNINGAAANGGSLTLGSGAVLEGQHIPAANSVDGAAIRAETTGGVVNILSGSIIRNNTSSNCGGAIAVGTNAVNTSITPITLNMSGGLIDNNQTDSNKRTKGAHGGGIWIGYNAIVNISGGTISNNIARGMGGGVYLGGTNSTLNLSNTLFDKNSSLLITDATANASAGFGGGLGIAGSASALTITGCTFTDNTANKAQISTTVIGGGGAIGVSGNQDLHLVNCTITGNHALFSAGGGVRTGTSTGGDIYIEGTTKISDNDAATYGGGIAYDSKTALYLSDNVKISGNKAYNAIPTVNTFGGAISTDSQTQAAQPLTISGNVEISGNTAGRYGGGIFSSSAITVSGSPTFSGNTAVKGGAIYGTGSIAVTGSASFTGNTATEPTKCPTGGAIFPAASNASGSLDLNCLTVSADAKFSGNVASHSFARLASDDALYAAKILATAWTSPINPGQGQGYNNYDIAYATYEIKVTSDGHGTGASNLAISRSSTEIDLTATPESGYQFNHWEVVSGGVVLNNASDSNAKFAMPPNDVEIKAFFSPLGAQDYTITANDDGNGTASSSLPNAIQNTKITLSATPDPGYKFNHWEVISGNVTLSNINDPGATFTMPANDVVITAHFVAGYKVYISTDGNGVAGLRHNVSGGSVSTAGVSTASLPVGGVSTLATSDQVSLTVPVGDTITHTAQASPGYIFDTWQCVSAAAIEMHTEFPSPGSSTCWCVMPANDVYLVALFKPVYTVYISAGEGGTATVSHANGSVSTASAALGATAYSASSISTLAAENQVALTTSAGTVITHAAQANPGYVFDTWTLAEEGKVEIVMNPAKLGDPAMASCWCVMPASDIHLKALFKPAPATSGTRAANTSAKTGDETPVSLYVLAMAAAAAVIAILLLAALRKRNMARR